MLSRLGFSVHVEKGAGVSSLYDDDSYREQGVTLVPSAAAVYGKARVVLWVRVPCSGIDTKVKFPAFAEGSVVVGLFQPSSQRVLSACRGKPLYAFALERMARITRAQSMDVLSSQSNLAGYGAVILAAYHSKQLMPMLMTAAGSIVPARCLVIGAGVAGLQAIATARRLGAIVTAMDVRASSKQQVESLGATFLEPEDSTQKDGETAQGYAKEMGADYQKKQQKLLEEALPRQDIVITSALIPDKPAPRILSEALVKRMKPGAVIVDLAAEAGGNCALTQPYQTINHHGVTIIGAASLAAQWAQDASRLFSRNICDFLSLLFADNPQADVNRIPWDDDIVVSTLAVKNGTPIERTT